MKNKKLLHNTISSFTFQIITILCGLILPRLILESYGSEVNGLINSITQFLGIVSFLELGVGAVVQSALYKPLSERDSNEISKIIVSANKFFRKLATILVIYVIILLFIFPIISNQNFGYLYTGILILSMSISSFAQYYFGIVNRLLLIADQRGFIVYNIQTITLIINTCLCYVFINVGASIQIVKLMTSIVFLIRPIILTCYVRKKYKINYKIRYSKEPIKQKWNGVAQHISSVVLDSTDIVILTIFTTLSQVSIYSVYNMVISGVKQLLIASTNGIQAVFGELWAKQKITELLNEFSLIEWIIHTITIIIFGSTWILIIPFIQVYTKGISDINYVQPIFAFLITLANSLHCLRLPYNIMILAGGHYKQTQKIYIYVALINIIVSIISVNKFGLIGVAIGTLVAMLFHTVCLAYYVSVNLIKWPFKNFIKQILIDIITLICIYLLTRWIIFNNTNYFNWIIMAIKVFITVTLTAIIINLLFFKEKIKRLFKSKK